MFKKLDQKQVELAREVAGKFQEIAKAGRFGPAADPFVIALARIQKQRSSDGLFSLAAECIVVSEERGVNRIPGACKLYGVDCKTLMDVFEREGWKF